MFAESCQTLDLHQQLSPGLPYVLTSQTPPSSAESHPQQPPVSLPQPTAAVLSSSQCLDRRLWFSPRLPALGFFQAAYKRISFQPTVEFLKALLPLL